MTAVRPAGTAIVRSPFARGSLARSGTVIGPVGAAATFLVDQPGPSAPQKVTVNDALVIGRNTTGLQVVDPAVSRRHLVLRLTPAGATVEDLGSRHGTLVNGERIAAETALRTNDTITLGSTTVRVLDPGRSEPVRRPTLDLRTPEAAPVSPTWRTVWTVSLVHPGTAPATVAIEGATEVGRDAGAGIVIPDATVSRRHLVLSIEDAGLVLADLGSSHGTTVNTHPVSGRVLLSPGDVIGCGQSTISVIGPHQVAVDPGAAYLASGPAGAVVTELDPQPTVPGTPAAPALAPPVLGPVQPRPVAPAPEPTPEPAAGRRRRIPVSAEPLPPFPNYTQLPRLLPIPAWHPVRAVSVTVFLGLVVLMFVRPDGALFFFWRLLVPVVPLVLVLAPGLWRNICPLAASNQVPRLFGFTRGLTAPPWLRDRGGGYLIGATLFLTIVPSRKVLFNTSGPATGVLLASVIVGAFIGGTIFKGKSGWCSSHCPMLPVERLYGQTPFFRIPNSHCQPCVGCTKHCYDFNPGVAYQADMADPDPDWSAPRKFFAGALPGVMIGFFAITLPDGSSPWETYGRFYLAVLASVGLFFVLDGYLRIPTSRLAAAFGATAFGLFYWYQAAPMADAFGQLLGVDLSPIVWPLRAAVIAMGAWWIVRTVLVERRFVEQAVGSPGVHLSPAATRFLAKGSEPALSDAAAGEGPEVRFVPDDKRAVAKGNQSILDVAEAVGLPIEVGCRMGMCGADPVAILDGMEHCSEIGEDEANTLRRLGFASSTRMACCARIDGPVTVSLTPEKAGSRGTATFDLPPDPSLQRVVIIGNGVAGTTTADFIRRGHPDCEIHVVGREPHPLYNRMGIARLVYGRSAMQGLYLFDDAWYDERGITSWLNTHAASISLAERTVVLATGDRLPFDRLVLAMGSASTVLPVPGWGVPGCFVMREASDAIAMRAFVQAHGVRSAVVAGAGLLGLEAAHALRELGLAVTVLDRGPRLMAKQSDDRCSELLGSYFAGLGIQVRPETQAATLEPDAEGRLHRVLLSDGATVDAGMFVVAAGITPNADLARDAGVATGRGVLVNARMETSAPGVYAVGDVAELDGQVPGLWPTAVSQAEVCATNILGIDERYDPGLAAVILKGVGLDMTSVGSYREEAGDEVVVLDGPGHEYRKLVVRGGTLVGAIVLGRPDDAAKVLAAVKKNPDVTTALPSLRSGDWSVL